MCYDAVYPGHPITLAWCIVKHFPGLPEALKGALTSADIPGAGGNVHSGLDVLRRLSSGMEFGLVVDLANRDWDECDNQKRKLYDRWKRGQTQAEEILPSFKELVYPWIKP